MSRSTFLVVLLFAGAAVAGCVAPGGSTDVAPQSDARDLAGWWETAVPSSATHEGHDHSDRSQHANLTTPNFEVVGWDPLVTDYYGETAKGMGCGGAVNRTDGRRIAIVHTISTDVAFIVADVTDPAKPVKLGEYLMPNAVIWDADITADGMHVLVGAYPPIFGDPKPVLPPLPPETQQALDDGEPIGRIQPMWRDACTGEVRAAGPEQYVPFGPGIVLVGIQNPEDPTFEDWVSQPVIGPHSVSSALIDGTVFAAASVTNLAHQGSYYTIFTVEDGPTGGKLVPYTAIRVPGTTTKLNGHVDVSIHKHPVTEQILAYLANWDGMYVYDISAPGPAKQIAVWMDGNAASVHTTYPFPELRDGKQYLAVGQEVGEPVDLPSGWTYLLDITDPTNPTELGRWTLPVKPKWDDGGLQFSPHYVAVLNDTMFVANYHGGLWAVDISDMSQPLASGLFVPHLESPHPYGGNGHGPVIDDVIADQTTGLLTTWDGAGGVYVLRFHENVFVPRAPAWPTSA